MEFKEFKEIFQKNVYENLFVDGNDLFEVEVDKEELWNTYLDSFPEGTNEVLRERREFDCAVCKNFIRNIGNLVVIDEDLNMKSLWSFITGSDKYQPVVDALNTYILSKPISNVFVTKELKYGIDKNYEQTEGKTIEWHHFFLDLPHKYKTTSRKSVDSIKSSLKSNRDVFKRSLEEITNESVETVLELINDNSLYKGEEWKDILEKFLELKKEFELLPFIDISNIRDLYVWKQSLHNGGSLNKIRNTSMGTLLVDISEGKDLDSAVRQYEKIVAPNNYKRPKSIFTQRMLDKAKEEITEMGYIDSLPRRHATLDDISVSNILFSNKDSAKRIGIDVFAEMGEEIGIDPKKFSRAGEVHIKDFIENVLPTAKELEVFVENKHTDSFVSLITAKNEDSPTMFKWGNNKSYSYTGNITDSMKQRVKSAGGNVDGDLRFSIQWNDLDYDENDLDAHCKEPDGNFIYFADMRSRKTGGVLDVDITNPEKGKVAVENITWANRNNMTDGTYKMYVHQYQNRRGKKGFRAEIEFDGEIFEYDYPNELRQGEKVPVAEVTLKDGVFSIEHKLSSNSSISSKEVWGVNTNQFVPVSVVLLSPNYWSDKGVGHKHYMFMLKGCINDENPSSFYNEFLKEELLEHKRVLEALASKMHVEDSIDQLSGLGFSSTKRNDVLVKVKGQTERVIKVVF